MVKERLQKASITAGAGKEISSWLEVSSQRPGETAIY